MAVTVPSVDRRILALCELFGHDVAHHPHTETDPGADICHHKGCQSAAIVGLHAAVGLGRQALDVLVCGCSEPAWCACDIEARRMRFTHAVRWADDLLRHLAAPWAVQAEQILNGQAKAEVGERPGFWLTVSDAGGGTVTGYVGRDTMTYPANGSRLFVTGGGTHDPMETGGMCDLHALIPRPCLWCGEEDG